MTDREQIRQEAQKFADNGWVIEPFAGYCLELLAELEQAERRLKDRGKLCGELHERAMQAERERDEAIEALEVTRGAVAAVPELVEALRWVQANCAEPNAQAIADDALAEYEQAQK